MSSIVRVTRNPGVLRSALAGALGVVLPLAVFGATAANSARTLSDFANAEEPVRRFIVASGAFEPDSFQNIEQPEPGAVRFTLRYFPSEWWDTDRDTDNKDRQRAEVKGLGPAQGRGEEFEYTTTWMTDPALRGLGKFCHVFQLKGVDGENSPPLVALSVLRTNGSAAVRYWPGGRETFAMVRQFKYQPGEASAVRIRVKTSSADGVADGAILVSINGDEFEGVRQVAVFRPRSTTYRAKWGFYRGFSEELPAGVHWVEHRNVSVTRIPPAAAPAPTGTPATTPASDPAPGASPSPASPAQSPEAPPANSAPDPKSPPPPVPTNPDSPPVPRADGQFSAGQTLMLSSHPAPRS